MKLENDLVEFQFDPATGSLQQVRDKRTGRAFLDEPAGARLFRLMIPTVSWTSRYADSHLGGRPEMRLEGDTLTIAFADLPCQGKPAGIEAVATVRLPKDSAEALFRLRVRNGSDVDIQEVRFPWVGGFRSIAGPGKDEVTIASTKLNPHGMFPLANPATFCRWRERQVLNYPFSLMLPYMDVSGGGNGLSYICYLKESRVGVMGLERLDPFGPNPSLSWSWASNPFVKPGQSWESPPVGIAVHQGDWHETAKRFRAWVGGWWKNPNPPRDLRHSIGLLNVQFTAFDGTEFHRFSDLPRLAREGLDAGVTHLCVWHRAGGLYCNKGDFREIMDEPPETLAELKQALAEVKRMGVNTSIILNLRLVRATMEPYRDLAETEPLRHRDGSPSRETYPTSHYHLASGIGPRYESGDGVVLCQRPSSRFAERARKLIARMLDLGFTSIFIDQPLNGTCCFAANHRHSAPDVAPDDCVRWMREVARMTKERSPESYVIGELPELFLTEQVDLWWHWPWAQLRPEVYRYSHPDALQLWVIDGDVGELNRAFALGFYANLTPAGMEQGIAARPDVSRQCARLARLRQKTAPWTVEARFADRDGLTLDAPATVAAAVFAGADRAGIILAETGGKSASVKLAFDPAALGLRFDRPGVVHTLEGKTILSTPPLAGTHDLQRELQPYEVAAWTFGGQSA